MLTCTLFCILNRHLFIRLRLVAVDFVTLALVVNRGSWFRQLHANVTYMHHKSWVIVLTKDIRFRQRLQHLDSGHGFGHEPVTRRFQCTLKIFLKRSHVRSRSGQRSEICVFGLLPIETGLSTVERPNSPKTLLYSRRAV